MARQTVNIYLAHPIDLAQIDVSRTRKELVYAGHAVFDPSEAWSMNKNTPTNNKLGDALMAVLRHCDALIAILDSKTPTIGTILELQYAKTYGMPAAIIGDYPLHNSWSLAYLGTPITHTLQAALKAIEEQQ